MKNITISTKFFDDERIVAISGEFGLIGEICVIKLLCEIRKNGYYLEWTTLKQNFLARTFGVTPDVLRAVVNRLAEYGFFSAKALKKYKVLTTEELQRVYFRPKSRRRDISNIPYLIIALQQAEPEVPAVLSPTEADTATDCGTVSDSTRQIENNREVGTATQQSETKTSATPRQGASKALSPSEKKRKETITLGKQKIRIRR